MNYSNHSNVSVLHQNNHSQDEGYLKIIMIFIFIFMFIFGIFGLRKENNVTPEELKQERLKEQKETVNNILFFSDNTDTTNNNNSTDTNNLGNVIGNDTDINNNLQRL
tara:strand:+ start:126 stop:449 length:324 start_codon:yes stop_codon:yes gene_type:complete